MNEQTDLKSCDRNVVESCEGLSYFEKFLPIWIAICIIIGILLSQFVPGLSETIDSWQLAGISIPIGICLFLMMYPAMMNLQASELKKLGKSQTDTNHVNF